MNKEKTTHGGAGRNQGRHKLPPEQKKESKPVRIPNEVASYLKVHLAKCKNAAVTDWLKKL